MYFMYGNIDHFVLMIIILRTAILMSLNKELKLYYYKYFQVVRLETIAVHDEAAVFSIASTDRL